jgi:hypothetical protein
MARSGMGFGDGIGGADSGVGIAVGFALHLTSCSSPSKPLFRSPAPAKHLVPMGDEV